MASTTLSTSITTRGDSFPNFISIPNKPLNPKVISFSFLKRAAPRGVAATWSTAEHGGALAAEEVDEEMGRIRRLQNGSDVRGVAIAGEKGRVVDLTAATVEAIAESFAEWVIEGMETGQSVSVSVGRDPRISGGALSVAVFAGVSRAGCLVFDMGLATTPACFMSTVLSPFSYDASIMVGSCSWTQIYINT